MPHIPPRKYWTGKNKKTSVWVQTENKILKDSYQNVYSLYLWNIQWRQEEEMGGFILEYTLLYCLNFYTYIKILKHRKQIKIFSKQNNKTELFVGQKAGRGSCAAGAKGRPRLRGPLGPAPSLLPDRQSLGNEWLRMRRMLRLKVHQRFKIWAGFEEEKHKG